MADCLYVCLQDEDNILSFAIDAGTGGLTPLAAVAVAGGPSVLALSPDRHMLYVGHRTQPSISSFRIDQRTGGLTPQGSVAAADAPTFLAADRTGRYLLSAYYQGGYAAVHPLGSDGAAGAPLSTGRTPPTAPTRLRPIPRTGSLLCRTSPGSTTTFWNRQRTTPAPISLPSSGSIKIPAV